MQTSQSYSGKRVVLAGASGLVGGYCLRFLLASPNVQEVIVFTRRSLNQTNPKLKEHLIDFSKMDQLSFENSTADAIICCLGTTIKQAGSQSEFEKVDLGYVVALAQWGIKHNAQHFLVVSSMGADEHSAFFYNQTKGKMETEISKLGYPSIDIFRPSLLIGQREQPRLGEKIGEIAMNLFNPIMLGPLRKYRAISAETVARKMVTVCTITQPGLRIHLSDSIQNHSSPID